MLVQTDVKSSAGPQPLWLSEIGFRRDGHDYEAVAYVWAPNREPARRRLLERLRRDGMELLRAEMLAAHECAWADRLRQQPAADENVVLDAVGYRSARALAPWTGGFGQREIALAATAAEAPTIPPELDALLFGGGEPSLGTAGDHAYAVIDANRFFGLVEQLENSGLRYRCLYKGAAAVKFQASAPFVVELRRGNRFTKMLFRRKATGPDASVWDQQAASFLVTPLGLDGLVAHLRKFTMLIDQQANKRYFFRFYAPEVMRSMVAALPPQKLDELGRGIRRMICHDGGKGAFVLERADAAVAGQEGVWA